MWKNAGSPLVCVETTLDHTRRNRYRTPPLKNIVTRLRLDLPQRCLARVLAIDNASLRRVESGWQNLNKEAQAWMDSLGAWLDEHPPPRELLPDDDDE
jgi:hypothetical protein